MEDTREIKFKYLVKRKNGHCFSEIFTLKDIELGKVKEWINFNYINEDTELYKLQFTGLYDIDKKEIYEEDIIEYFDWCYMHNEADKENHKIIHSHVARYGIRKGELSIHYYNPLIGVVKWNNLYSTYEPLVCEQDDYNNNCFYNVINSMARNPDYPDSYCKIIGNTYENPELII